MLFSATSTLFINENRIGKHLVVLRRRDIGNRLFKDHACRVDNDVYMPVLGKHVLEELLNCGRCRKAIGVDGDLNARVCPDQLIAEV